MIDSADGVSLVRLQAFICNDAGLLLSMEHLPMNQNTVAFIKDDAFENTVFTMSAIFTPQRVKLK